MRQNEEPDEVDEMTKIKITRDTYRGVILRGGSEEVNLPTMNKK